MTPPPRLQYLTPKFQSAELTCKPAPRGQLPTDSNAQVVSDRIIDSDEAGEDCRQTVTRLRMKIEVFNEVVSEFNKTTKVKK